MSGVRARLWVAGVLGALAVLVVLALLVLQLGRKDPSPPSLRDNPNPAIPGRIAYIDSESCIWVAEASGATRKKVACSDFPDWVSWVDADTVGFASYAEPGRTHWFEVDIGTGDVRDLGVINQWPREPSLTRPDGVTVRIDYDDGTVYRVEGTERTVMYSANYPDGHVPRAMFWSPDGRWLVLQYWAPRANGAEVWIVAEDGTAAGTLATGVWGSANPVSWWIDGLGFTPDTGVVLPD
ncbi:MAG: hypothetical protein Kow0010_09000 [Dehalococcoidia bacterium]